MHLLMDHAIAGTVHHCTVAELNRLREGDKLKLVREPHNPHDANAVRIEFEQTGKKLGYIPRTHSAIIAALLDSKKVQLHAEVGDWTEPKSGLCHFRLYLM